MNKGGRRWEMMERWPKEKTGERRWGGERKVERGPEEVSVCWREQAGKET